MEVSDDHALRRVTWLRMRADARSGVQLEHVAILDNVIATHLLGVEVRMAPHPRVLQVGGDVAVDESCDVPDGRARWQGVRAVRIDILAGDLRVHTHDTEVVEQPRREFLEPLPRLRRHRQERVSNADQFLQDGEFLTGLLAMSRVGRTLVKRSTSGSSLSSIGQTSVSTTRRASRSSWRAMTRSTHPGELRSTTRRHPSAGCRALLIQGTG